MYISDLFFDVMADSRSKRKYIVGGAVVLDSIARDELKLRIKALLKQHKLGGQFKWRKVNPARIAFYKELMDYVLSDDSTVEFRLLVAEKELLCNPKTFLKKKKRFCKLYRELTDECMADEDTILFADMQQEDNIQLVKKDFMLEDVPVSIQAVKAKQSSVLALSTFMTEMVESALSEAAIDGSGKSDMIKHIESILGYEIRPVSGESGGKLTIRISELILD